MKERHDRVLDVLVRAVMRALGLRFPSPYKTLGGCAKPGVFGTDETMVMVDQVCPTDRVVTEARPDMVVRVTNEKRLLILEVACAWEPLIAEREREKRGKYQDLAADSARQNPGYQTRVVPVVIGDLGTVGQLRQHLRDSKLMDRTDVDGLVRSLQRKTLCGTTKLMKRHFTL